MTESATASSELNYGFPIDPTNPTSIRLVNEILEKGRIPFSSLMQEALFGPDGYYTNYVSISTYDQDGRLYKGDFITSPEHNPLFAKMIAKGIEHVWKAMGKPNNFSVVEIGAGEGSLPQKILDTIKSQYPELYNNFSYRIVEISKVLTLRQQARLTSHGEKVSWDNMSVYDCNFSDVNGVIVSNEIPDTAPIERVKLIEGEIKQCYVIIDQDRFKEIWDTPTDEVLSFIHDNNISLPDNGYEEPINLSSVKFQQVMDTLGGGVVMTFDYGGYNRLNLSSNVSVRAYSKISPERLSLEGVYENLGHHDITANVNFGPMVNQAERDGVKVLVIGPQNRVLGALNGRSVCESWLEERIANCKSVEEMRDIVNIIFLQAGESSFGGLLTATSGLEIPLSYKISQYFSQNRIDFAGFENIPEVSIKIPDIYKGKKVTVLFGRIKKEILIESDSIELPLVWVFGYSPFSVSCEEDVICSGTDMELYEILKTNFYSQRSRKS